MEKEGLVLYQKLYDTYDLFNKVFFDNILPPVLITLQIKRKANGYYFPERYIYRNDTKRAIDEIALNPETFFSRDSRAINSTLLHEMTHLWQEKHGSHKPKNGYHNKEWGDQMEKFGLIPSNTGQEGGKKTGVKMTHYILDGGLYDEFYKKNEAKLEIDLGIFVEPVEQKERQIAPTFKFSCPQCGEELKTKNETLNIVCGKCIKPFEKSK